MAYNGNIQRRFAELHEFINNCGISVWRWVWRWVWKLRRIRIWKTLEAGSSPESPGTESPETKIYNTLTSLRLKEVRDRSVPVSQKIMEVRRQGIRRHRAAYEKALWQCYGRRRWSGFLGSIRPL
jgi:hypothetical protein